MPGSNSRLVPARRGSDRATPAAGQRQPGRSASFTAWIRSRVGSPLPDLKAESLLPELVAIGCFLILPWIGITVALKHEHHSTEAAAVQSTGNLAQALEESTRRTIGQIDYILLSARAMQAAQGGHFDFNEWAKKQTFADKMTVQIAMADRDGLVTGSTIALPPGISIVDRPHFQAQIDPAHDALFISHPVTGRVSGLQTIQFSRKLLDANGGFAGVVVLSLGSVELARFYEALGLGNGFVSVLSADGTILARGPWITGLAGTGITGKAEFHQLLDRAAGSVNLPGSLGQPDEIASYRHLRDYPLIVMVGFDTDAVFARYRSLRINAVATGLGITLAVGLVGFFWARQKRRSILSRRALKVTLDTISQGILMVDGQKRISVINPRALDLLALPDEPPETTMQFVVARAAELIPEPSNRDAVPDGHESPVLGGRFETTLENGAIIEVRTHSLPDGGFVQTYTDVTEQRLAHAQVKHLAHHDVLTGLANRVELRQRISGIIDRHAAQGGLTALMMVDLDGFKGVNDTLGHDAGDELLIEVGERLKALVRGTDIVARLGGDEFVILAAGLTQPEDILPLAQRVLRRLSAPTQVHGHQIRIGASVGIAFHPQDGADIDTLFRHADMALYSAKTSGRGVYRCFEEKLTHAVAEYRLLESELSRAIDTDALEVFYQPKFSAVSLRIVGFEALARWRHPTRGFVSPDVFIRVAENCGLINRLGQWILEQACAVVAALEPPIPIAVNVSVMQLRDTGLKDVIAMALTQARLRPQDIEIEVTESVLADDDETVLGNLKAIKAMGVKIALDDFGTGYSSLSYLRRFPFDKIKIDKSFVQGQENDPGVRVILEAILGMCQNLGLATIAEGVETTDQLTLLQARGCSEIQGYLLGRPMPRDQVQPFIQNYSAREGERRQGDGGQGKVQLVS